MQKHNIIQTNANSSRNTTAKKKSILEIEYDKVMAMSMEEIIIERRQISEEVEKKMRFRLLNHNKEESLRIERCKQLKRRKRKEREQRKRLKNNQSPQRRSQRRCKVVSYNQDSPNVQPMRELSSKQISTKELFMRQLPAKELSGQLNEDKKGAVDMSATTDVVVALQENIQLTAVHTALLNMQEAVDQYLSFKASFRCERYTDPDFLFKHLQNIGFGIHTQPYFARLLAFDSQLYTIASNNMIKTQARTSVDILIRKNLTKELMRRKKI